MNQTEILISIRGLGFIMQGASYDDMRSVAKASLRQAFLDWSRSDKTQEIYFFIQNFPQAIESGTTVPEAVLERMKPPVCTEW
ncbi:hypothetical protein F5B18DRAFT_637774 [Nemania serpens]|nr:hypothetical protein F5B18DRAFT_637774 [Nemania serpens]